MRLTAELQQTICAFIRAGSFLHVAAEAAGVPEKLFTDWLERGNRPGARSLYRSFANEVRRAAAQARASAEMVMLSDKPETWLRNGPGRELPSHPGWTTTAPPIHGRKQSEVNLLLEPDMQHLLNNLLKILGPFPEARTAVSQALLAQGIMQTEKAESSKS